MINKNHIQDILLNRFGVVFNINIVEENENLTIDIVPDNINVSETFFVRLKRGWKSISAEFVPGNFSGFFIKEMGDATNYQKKLFTTIAKKIIEMGIDIKLTINGQKMDPLKIDSCYEEWYNISFQLKKIPVDFDEMNELNIEDLLISMSTKILGLVMSLVTLELDDEKIELEGYPEGAKTRIEVNKYERNSLNRAMCIDARGTKCTVCEFDFNKHYGDIGEGFIHVHHKTQVSEIGEDYVIDPINDLVPVCPNCHAMLHINNPPLDIEVLKKIIMKNINNNR